MTTILSRNILSQLGHRKPPINAQQFKCLSSGSGTGSDGNKGSGSNSRKLKRTESNTLKKKMKRHHSAPGLGSAAINSHYDYLGGGISIPKFLKSPKTVSVVGAPISWGQPLPGTDLGPTLLRQCGLISCLEALEWTVDEKGDIEFDEPQETDPVPDENLIGGKAKNCYCLGKALEKVYRETKASLEAGHFALTLGGDHSIGLATTAAVLAVRPESGIIWADAHGDINVPATSPSGNMHGMPLGLLMKLCDPNLLPGFEWLNEVPVLSPDRLVFVGLRDLDKGERAIIRSKGIKAYTMHHVDHYGIGKVMDYAVEYLSFSDGTIRPLHLSYDIDACDPAEAPSTGTVVRGGVNFREAHYIAEAASSTGALQSMDLVEVNPTLRPGTEAELTSHLGMALIASAMGSRIL